MARIAQQERVDLFAVGSEYVGLEVRTPTWRNIISSVRKVYFRELTYVANHDVRFLLSFPIKGETGRSLTFSPYYSYRPTELPEGPLLGRGRRHLHLRLLRPPRLLHREDVRLEPEPVADEQTLGGEGVGAEPVAHAPRLLEQEDSDCGSRRAEQGRRRRVSQAVRVADARGAEPGGAGEDVRGDSAGVHAEAVVPRCYSVELGGQAGCAPV